MSNFTFFLVGILLAVALISLSACGTVPPSSNHAQFASKTLTREQVRDWDMERVRRKFERDHIEHSAWVRCVKTNGYNSEGC